jgi:glycosyltransferase involved in cell wall biosynthesis
MKVLHIISSGGMYGAESVILNLLRITRDTPNSAALGIFYNEKNPNCQFYDAAAREGFSPQLIQCNSQFDRSTINAIRELAAREQADVIHAHGYKADIYCYLAFRGTQMPLVSTCHTWYDTDVIVTLYGKLDRFVLRSYSRVVAVSEEVKQRLLDAGVRADRIHIVRNGIDLRPFDRPRVSAGDITRNLVVGLVGRLAWEKGVDLYLAAAAEVVREFPTVRFVVIGEGPDRDKLNAQIDELGIRSHAELVGRREDMPAAYASLDVMVSASRQEGLPMAILEGMASRLPIVATFVGDVPKLIRNRQTGLLVAPNNVETLAAAILTMLRDSALRDRLGAAARKLVEDEYSADRMTADYLRVYQEALVARGVAK